MKPSDVVLAPHPFLGTFWRTEIEMLVFAIVRTCAVKGDYFRAVYPRDVGEVERADLLAGNAFAPTWGALAFVGIDIAGAIARDVVLGIADQRDQPLALTELGLNRLRHVWVGPNAGPLTREELDLIDKAHVLNRILRS